MTELPRQVLHTLKKQYHHPPSFHTLPSRKKFSEVVGGSQEYGQEEKKSISLVKGLLSCSSRVPNGWKSPQSYLHIYSLGGDLPSCTLEYNFPSAHSPVHAADKTYPSMHTIVLLVSTTHSVSEPFAGSKSRLYLFLRQTLAMVCHPQGCQENNCIFV